MSLRDRYPARWSMTARVTPSGRLGVSWVATVERKLGRKNATIGRDCRSAATMHYAVSMGLIILNKTNSYILIGFDCLVCDPMPRIKCLPFHFQAERGTVQMDQQNLHVAALSGRCCRRLVGCQRRDSGADVSSTEFKGSRGTRLRRCSATEPTLGIGDRRADFGAGRKRAGTKGSIDSQFGEDFPKGSF